MPVTFDNLKNTVQTATTTCKVILTAAANTVLLAFFAGKDAASVSSCEYGGAALTRLAQAGNNGTGMKMEVWGLTAPAAGVHTLSAAVNVATRWQMAGVTYLNAKAVAPFGTVASATATLVNNISISVSAQVNSMVVGAIACTTYISASNATSRLNAQDDMGMFVGDTAGAATVSLSAGQITDASGSWAMVALPIFFSVGTVASIALTGAGF